MMSTKQTCPNCPPAAGTRTVFTLLPDIRVLKCRGCQLQFAETYPDLDTAETEIYGDRYFVEAIEQRRERLTTFNELMTEIESMVGRKGRLLDVGCGDGVLLEVAADNGWEAEGTDVATAVVRHTRDTKGLAVHQGEVEDIVLERGSFDVIVLNHVLEHVRDPRATLSRLRDLLADDGVIRVEVPNVASLSAITQNIQSRYNLKKNRWRHYETGHHFWFFTPRTLARTLNGAGLTPFQISAPAEQWGRVSRYKRTLNVLYRLTFWGGHLIAYARPGNKP